MQVILKGEIIQKLKEVGLKSGDTVMVHTSLGKMGYVCGGAQAVIEALMEVVGDSGTIMMPTQSWKNLDPETGVHWEADQKDWQLIRDNWPAYDKNLTPTNTMGAVAEMFRQCPERPPGSVCVCVGQICGISGQAYLCGTQRSVRSGEKSLESLRNPVCGWQ